MLCSMTVQERKTEYNMQMSLTQNCNKIKVEKGEGCVEKNRKKQ